MINGFEIQTHELTEYELTVLLPKIVSGLGTKKGKASAITNKKICKAMKDRGFEITEARLRKLVNHIRVKGIIPFLIATSSGYYIAESKEEVETYIESLGQRANEILRVKKSFENHLRNLIDGKNTNN